MEPEHLKKVYDIIIANFDEPADEALHFVFWFVNGSMPWALHKGKEKVGFFDGEAFCILLDKDLQNRLNAEMRKMIAETPIHKNKVEDEPTEAEKKTKMLQDEERDNPRSKTLSLSDFLDPQITRESFKDPDYIPGWGAIRSPYVNRNSKSSW